MKQNPILRITFALLLIGLGQSAVAQAAEATPGILAFGHGGGKKMLYDNRQRPQAVYLNGKVFIGYKGNAERVVKGVKRKKLPGALAYTLIVSYDPLTREFSDPIQLGEPTSDHHFCPIVWADNDDHLHVLHGCHNTSGTHLISMEPGEMGQDESTGWVKAGDIAPNISYPTLFQADDNRQLLYYRTGGHTSSWSYSLSSDNGRTWQKRDQDVTDLDAVSHPQWSSYHCKIMSADGRFLHVFFTDYDDNKPDDPARYYNPRYKRAVPNEWKYNLSYLKINLATHEVLNDRNIVLDTPVNFTTAREHCLIWDTDWRGAGVPPAVMLDHNGNPAVLHVLSEEDTETHTYYYVRKDSSGTWVHTPVTASNHQWNSGYIRRDEQGQIHAYVIVGEGYLNLPGVNNTHGGGRIEQWVSKDHGNTWAKFRDITPDPQRYAGMRYNNIQPILRPDGSAVDGMLLFYGWKHDTEPDGVAFLLDESSQP